MLVTRFELALRQHPSVGIAALVEGTTYARQHLLRLRMGEAEPSRRAVVAITSEFARLSGEVVTADQLFERAGELLSSRRSRLSDVHAADLRAVADLLNEPLRDDWPVLIRDTGIASETVVRLLLQTARRRLDRRPPESEVIYEAARAMAAALRTTPGELQAALQAHALSGRANALRLLGKLDESLSVLAAAAALFVAAGYCDKEAGDVDIGRAATLFKLERWGEAVEAARMGRRRFKRAGNSRRRAHCCLIEAAALFEQGNHDAAREIWINVLETLTALRDREGVGRVCLNLGACDTARGRPHLARHWLNRASAILRLQRRPLTAGSSFTNVCARRARR